ncbi:serine hydrolase [Sphingomonas spermidinifaciens]|uniref:Serine hydrolase n=1 Tax=Sphingomonas spermidinifaciens TaxID=1141889 RepID=A0A2A4B4W1_9SPHN|nr:serine hydrolase [Sphingomonas spermidinifaciens]PCD02809.1 serine hydrolase [Sphingomonas spermidinifaciens]
MPIAALALALVSPQQPPPPAEPVAGARVVVEGGKVVAAQSAGFADPAAARRATVDDPVRVASISKLVVAIGVMRLVEAGTLDLDSDVSARLGWRLRHPRFPDVPITLRLLLSHRSGLADGIDYVLPLDADLQAALSDPKAWGAEAPGGYFRYANIAWPVIASVMERATGERFDRLMDRLVLAPLDIAGCFQWEACDAATAARAVVLVEPDGTPIRDDNRGTKPVCSVTPARSGGCSLASWEAGRNGAIFSPQGGLRISAQGLAKIGRLIAGSGSVDGVRLLTPASVRAMTTPAWTYDGRNGAIEGGIYCRYGLGVMFTGSGIAGCPDDLFGDGRPRVGHAGEAYRLRSGLWVEPGGRVTAYWSTGIPQDAPLGSSGYSAIEERLARGR